MPLKTLPIEERPRERLVRHGADAVSTIELIAILLGSGTKNRSVLELAADLLGHFGSIRRLSEATLQELKAIKGIGTAKALQLQAVFSVARRIEGQKKGELLDAPDAIYEQVKDELSRREIEVLLILLCDVRQKLIHREILSQGTLTEVLLHPREVFHVAIRHRAHSVILAHNHPSGDPTPSARDLEMTQLLVTVGRIVGIELMDHLIIGKDRYISLRQQKIIPSSHSGTKHTRMPTEDSASRVSNSAVGSKKFTI